MQYFKIQINCGGFMNLKFLSVFLCSLFILSISCISATTGTYDTLRTKTGSAVIKCSPDGKAEGSLSPGEAIRSLKKGSVLHLLPGSYDSSLSIDIDGLIIEGEPGKHCDVRLSLKGKKNIVRNLWASQIECETDITIIDSVIGYYTCENNDKKMEQDFYNSCFGSITIYSYKDNKLSFTKCNVVSENSHAIYFSWGDGNISFTNCILYGKNTLFSLPERDKGNDQGVRISLENTLLYGEVALADGSTKNGVNNWGGKEEKALDLKGLKKLAKQMTSKGDVISEKPVFKKELQRREFDYSGGYLDLKKFILDDKSPGKNKNIGANLNDAGFPVPEQPKDAKKTATATTPPPPVKPAADEKPAKIKSDDKANSNDLDLSIPGGPPAKP
jgi:hypothetical protein